MVEIPDQIFLFYWCYHAEFALIWSYFREKIAVPQSSCRLQRDTIAMSWLPVTLSERPRHLYTYLALNALAPMSGRSALSRSTIPIGLIGPDFAA